MTQRYNLFLLVCLFCLSCGKQYEIPTNSMSPTLNPGDFISVEEDSAPARNDIIVFNGNEPMPAVGIARLIAIKGDELSMKENKVYINGRPESLIDLAYGFQLNSTGQIRERVFEEYRITSYLKNSEGYIIHTNNEVVAKLQELPFIKGIEPLALDSAEVDEKIFPDFSPGNAHNLNTIVVPYKDMEIKDDQLIQYAETIRLHEGQDITGLNSYIFTQDYGFVLGDNRDQSYDSRFYGFIPLKNVTGKVKLD